MSVFFDWTKEAVSRLTFLWCEDGASASVIARVMSNEFGASISRNMVIGKAHRLGLRHPHSGQHIRKSRKSNIPVVKKSLTTRPPGKLSPAPIMKSLAPALAPIVSPEPDIVESHGDGVRLVDLRETTCRFPIGDPRDDSFRFCGAASPIGKPYCKHHARIAYIHIPAPSKTRKSEDRPAIRAVQFAAY